MRPLNYPSVISTIALATSAGALLLSYLQYSSTFESTEFHWKMLDISIDFMEAESKFQIASNLDFAVKNESNNPLYLASCKFRLENAHSGREGWETKLVSCPEFEDRLAENGKIIVEPGQTIFFKDTMLLLGDSDNLMATMERLGIYPDTKTDSIFPAGRKDCRTGFSLRTESQSFGGDCFIQDDSKLFTLVLQTGTGRYIEGEFVFGPQEKNWPWQRSKL